MRVWKLSALVYVALVSCSAPQPPPHAVSAIPEITAASEEGGFVDLGFSIRSADFDSAGNCRVVALGTHKGKPVGLAVTFSSGMVPGLVGVKVAPGGFKKDGISYSSIGPESDALLEVLASLYEKDLKRHTFAKEVSGTAFALGGDPANIRTEALKFKVFFNDSSPNENYAELYTNIDLHEGILQLFEKDPEYRAAIINTFAGGP